MAFLECLKKKNSLSWLSCEHEIYLPRAEQCEGECCNSSTRGWNCRDVPGRVHGSLFLILLSPDWSSPARAEGMRSTYEDKACTCVCVYMCVFLFSKTKRNPGHLFLLIFFPCALSQWPGLERFMHSGFLSKWICRSVSQTSAWWITAFSATRFDELKVAMLQSQLYQKLKRRHYSVNTIEWHSCIFLSNESIVPIFTPPPSWTLTFIA